MAGPGRNEPCPCGSGRKYKHCCLRREQAPLPAIRDVDGVVTPAVLHWMREEQEEAMQAARPWLPTRLWTSQANTLLVTQLLTWEVPDQGGLPLCLRVPSRVTNRFSELERGWLTAQQEAHFSLCDVLEVRRDEGLFLHDRLTGAKRFAREKQATHSITDRMMVVARTARLAGTWVLCATHGFSLTPEQADPVEREARRLLGLGRRTARPAELRGQPAFDLARLWDEAVVAAQDRPLPELRTGDGDPLELVQDRYRVPAGQDASLRAALLALPGAEDGRAALGPDESEAAEAHAEDAPPDVVLSTSRPNGDVVHLAGCHLAPGYLMVNAHSVRRADELRSRLEAPPFGLTHEARETTDPRTLVEASPDQPAAERPPRTAPPPEAAAMVRAYKEKHYASWVDEPIPALGGVTPREAARDKRRRVYRDLEVQLRELERLEGTLPPEERYDVGILRRELDM